MPYTVTINGEIEQPAKNIERVAEIVFSALTYFREKVKEIHIRVEGK